MDCDPAFQKELDKINLECSVDDAMALATFKMKAQELGERAYRRGEAYGDGWADGWNESLKMSLDYERGQVEAVHQKTNDLLQRWGLEQPIK